MDLEKITDKEIQFNIMISLMKIEGHLSDMVEQRTQFEYDLDGGDEFDFTGLNQ